MPAHYQQLIKKIVFRSLSTLLIASSAIFSFSILGNAFSQLLTYVVYYYNALLKQESPLP